MKILPIIHKDAEQTISKSYITDQFKKAGLTVKSISTDEIGTGTKIQASDGTTYTVLIYGDVDGDGYVDTFDAGAIIRHYVFEGNYTLTGVYKLAAMLDEDDEIDTFDAGKIVQFYVGNRNDLVTNEPVSDKEKDTTAPVISLNGSNIVSVNLGSTYTDAGATAIDNVDGNITSKIKVSSNVNTSKVGTYYVTYTVSDNAGNTATNTRKVEVVDYLASIEITRTN